MKTAGYITGSPESNLINIVGLQLAKELYRLPTRTMAGLTDAKVVDASVEHFLFELTGKVSKVDQFISIMRPLGLVEICRTGPASMNRGPQGM